MRAHSRLELGPIPTEMIQYVKEASMFILALRMRDARIAPGAAAVLAKEPSEGRREEYIQFRELLLQAGRRHGDDELRGD